MDFVDTCGMRTPTYIRRAKQYLSDHIDLVYLLTIATSIIPGKTMLPENRKTYLCCRVFRCLCCTYARPLNMDQQQSHRHSLAQRILRKKITEPNALKTTATKSGIGVWDTQTVTTAACKILKSRTQKVRQLTPYKLMVETPQLLTRT